MIRLKPPTLEKAVSFLSSTPLFAGLSQELLEDLAGELKWIRHEDGATVLTKGAPAHSMYLVYNGALESVAIAADGGVSVEGEWGPGESVDELAVLACGRRRETARAKGETILIRLPRTGLIKLAMKHATAIDQITGAIQRRQRQLQLNQILHKSKLFADLSPAFLADMAQEMTWVSLADDDDFVRQGDLGDFLGVVISGRLQVRVTLPGGELRIVNELGPGDSVGKWALFTGERRTATVRAIRDSELVKLSKTSFDRLVGRHPHEMMRAFAGTIIERLPLTMHAPNRKKDTLSTVAIVATTADVPLTEFSTRLERAFASLGDTIYLNSQKVDQILEIDEIAQTRPDGIHNSRLLTWLNAQEYHSEYLLLEADLAPTPWSLRCLRQADLVLIVGRAGADPGRGPVERELLTEDRYASTSRRILGLIHDDEAGEPAGTKDWLAVRQVQGHQHLRWSRQADYERLARTISGRAIGVVLSGGGARGTAHLGVLRAIDEAGIAIDHIGGNSMGTIISAGYAMGFDTGQMHALAREMYKPRNFFDPTIPLVSMLSRRRMVRFAKKIMGDRQIEDLWIPYFCVSSNLTRAEVAVHDSGPMLRWVLASNSLPGLMPPVVHQGDLFYDGALLDDLPLDIMREKIGTGTVIAVDVSPPIDLAENPDIGLHLSGWQVLWSRINPFTPRIDLPNIATVLQRAGELSSKRTQRILVNSQLADLYLRPPVEHFSITDSKELDKIVEIGYESAVEQIALWQSKQAGD